MTSKKLDLSKIPKEYYGKWIAVEKATSTVIAAAGTMKSVTDKATKTNKDFMVTVIEPCPGGYIL